MGTELKTLDWWEMEQMRENQSYTTPRIPAQIASQGLSKTKLKAKISKAFSGLRDYGFKVYNFSSHKKMLGNCKGWSDIVVIKRNVYFIEIKILNDTFSEEQIEYAEELIWANQYYLIVTENNFNDICNAMYGTNFLKLDSFKLQSKAIIISERKKLTEKENKKLKRSLKKN